MRPSLRNVLLQLTSNCEHRTGDVWPCAQDMGHLEKLMWADCETAVTSLKLFQAASLSDISHIAPHPRTLHVFRLEAFNFLRTPNVTWCSPSTHTTLVAPAAEVDPQSFSYIDNAPPSHQDGICDEINSRVECTMLVDFAFM